MNTPPLGLDRPEMLLGVAVGIVILVYLFIVWIREAQAQPDPWGSDIETQIESDGVEPLCLRCLAPHPEETWFCPNCGLATGATTNLSPFLYLFSVGDAFRAMAAGKVRFSSLTFLGSLFVSAVVLSVLVPVYWYFFFRNMERNRRASTPPEATVA